MTVEVDQPTVEARLRAEAAGTMLSRRVAAGQIYLDGSEKEALNTVFVRLAWLEEQYRDAVVDSHCTCYDVACHGEDCAACAEYPGACSKQPPDGAAPSGG